MNYKKFEELLKLNDLNKKEFAKITELSYQTVMNWNHTDNVPKWVRSWLENFRERKRFENVKKTLKESGACE